MISDKGSLYNLASKSLDSDIESRGLSKSAVPKFRGFIKKDSQGVYSLVDRENSIKCIFDEKKLKEHLAGLPSYITFESFVDHEISLNDYYFDILVVKTNASDQNISTRLILYVIDFSVDIAKLHPSDNFPKNLNLNPEIRDRVDRVFNQHTKQVLQKTGNVESFDASKFIKKNLDKSSVFGLKDVMSLIIGNNQNKNNILLKANVSIENSDKYLQFDNVDDLITNHLQKIDYAKLYLQQPSQVSKKNTDFIPSESVLVSPEGGATDADKLDYSFFLRPTHLSLEDEEPKMTATKFLSHKVKRAKTPKDIEKLPPAVQDLFKKYGDVCANITVDTLEKFKFYQKFQTAPISNLEK